MSDETSNETSDETSDETREKNASLADEVDSIIKKHALAAMGVGLIPAPLLDLAAIAGIQLNMIRRMAKIHAISFNEEKVKHLIGSLIGSGGSLQIASIVRSVVKIIPLIGPVAGALALSISAGATTYAVGKVFYTHFASGGTFLSFKPEKVKAHYARLLKEGKTVAADLA